MSGKFIATVLATALTITSFTAAPVRAAETRDIAAVLGAAATLFVIGSAIQNARQDDERSKSKVIVRDHGYQGGRYDNRDHRDDNCRGNDRGGHNNRCDDNNRGRHDDKGHKDDRGHNNKGKGDDKGKGNDKGKSWDKRPSWSRQLAPLPSSCLIDQRGRQNSRGSVFGANCLGRNYSQANRLPNACRTTISTPRGRSTAYNVSCLKNRGYRIARY
ncbi:hypothetical protein [Puniceibacterium sp. IMCC21224]|uniref:hypothetical protein n=1 Tax=Puniceibacterium sp. IMCC21224 TaxID=1618204 RepID=UPI00065CE4D0|nr:hypothetical protein [Puniceibacterium sp. IMCC21224]KMK68521.1 hypothetical protein IMCC21224_113403 [Puniceibacterium sp. IMCC21224]